MSHRIASKVNRIHIFLRGEFLSLVAIYFPDDFFSADSKRLKPKIREKSSRTIEYFERYWAQI
jgi:hypothetical protein